jgi:putative transposase
MISRHELRRLFSFSQPLWLCASFASFDLAPRGLPPARARAEIRACCLMPNHMHAIVTPKDEAGPPRTFGDLHRRTTGHINARNRWTGHLWQARFGSMAVDEEHLIAAIRYVSLNPVRARLVE